MTGKRRDIIRIERLSDGRLIRLWPDGRRTPYRMPKVDMSRLDRLSDAQLTAAARGDRDNPPLTARDLRRFAAASSASPQAATIRRRARLSQAAFAKLVGVSIGTLQGWEQGRRKPAGPARALLRILARRPELIREALTA